MVTIKKDYIHIIHKGEQELEGLNIVVHETNDVNSVKSDLFYKNLYLDRGGLKPLHQTNISLNNFTTAWYDDLREQGKNTLQNIHNVPCISNTKVLFCEQYWDVEVLNGVFRIVDTVLNKGLHSLQLEIKYLNSYSDIQFSYVIETNTIKICSYYSDDITYKIKDINQMYMFINKYKMMFY